MNQFWFYIFLLGCMKVSHAPGALNFLSMFNAISPTAPVSVRMGEVPPVCAATQVGQISHKLDKKDQNRKY